MNFPYSDLFLKQFPDLLDVANTFPLHKISEISFVLKLSDRFNIYLGFPNRPELRDYGISRFINIAKEYSLKTWLLGLKPKFIRYIHLFDGCDVTPVSLIGVGFRNLMDSTLLEKYAKFISSLLTKEHFPYGNSNRLFY